MSNYGSDTSSSSSAAGNACSARSPADCYALLAEFQRTKRVVNPRCRLSCLRARIGAACLRKGCPACCSRGGLAWSSLGCARKAPKLPYRPWPSAVLGQQPTDGRCSVKGKVEENTIHLVEVAGDMECHNCMTMIAVFSTQLYHCKKDSGRVTPSPLARSSCSCQRFLSATLMIAPICAAHALNSCANQITFLS
jgi:hypothetical protein